MKNAFKNKRAELNKRKGMKAFKSTLRMQQDIMRVKLLQKLAFGPKYDSN